MAVPGGRAALATITTAETVPGEQQLPKRANILDRQELRLAERLLAKRRINSQTGCWEWQGRRDRCGYGWITVAHRRCRGAPRRAAPGSRAW